MKQRTAVLSTAVLLLSLSGCVLPGMSTRNDYSGLPPIQTFADDIHDIMMPAEMEWDRTRSMTIKTESFHGGVWHYSGKVETMSLKDYMLNAMQDSKWKLVGEAASSDIMFAFVKPHKTCMMVISEGDFRSTRLTLYVTIDKTAAVKLNPFGEPAAPLPPSPQKQEQRQEQTAPEQQAVQPLDDLSY
ncbi:MAG: hypothetical protein ACTFAL_13365 [Candidatus Electronema sp. V4]|uniref:hypothetical protein n=1 Tax=Candidatus Electronema sp. V4 TaxID=3454756 RepID=UPI00405553CE